MNTVIYLRVIDREHGAANRDEGYRKATKVARSN